MEKEHSDFTEFENKISTKGIGPVTKYSRSGKVRNGGCCFFFHPGYILYLLLFTTSTHSAAIIQADHD